MISIKLLNNITGQICGEMNKSLKDELIKNCSYKIKGSFFSDKYQSGIWDGRKNLLSPVTWRFPLGVFARIRKTLSNENVSYEVNDERIKPNIVIEDYKLNTIEFRDYQEEAIKIALLRGRGIIKIGTGGGKGLIIAGLVNAFSAAKINIFAHRNTLLCQLENVFKLNGINNVGFIGDGIRDEKRINLCSVASMTVKKVNDSGIYKFCEENKNILKAAEVIIIDECFRGKTLISTETGYKTISSICRNKYSGKVWSFNILTKRFELKTVTNWFIKKCSDDNIMSLHINKSKIYCTKNHPFYNEKFEKISAEDIKSGDRLITFPRNLQGNSTNKYGLSIVKNINTKINTKASSHLSNTYYNITVDDNHNYIAQNILVGNCQHLGADTLQAVSKYSPNAYYRYGFTATPYRDAGDDILIEAATGRLIVDYGASELIKRNWLVKPTIYFLDIPDYPGLKSEEYSVIYSKAIVNNAVRNQYISMIATRCYNSNKTCLIAVNHIKHGELLLELLNKVIPENQIRFIKGSSGSGEEKLGVLEQLNNKKISIVISTTVFGEGVDVPSLNCLINTKASKSYVDTLQLCGRVLRKSSEKTKATIIDFYDKTTPYLRVHAKSRLKILSEEPEFAIKRITSVEDILL